MNSEIGNHEVGEVKNHNVENFNNIKPEKEKTSQEVADFWKSEFHEQSEQAKTENNTVEEKNFQSDTDEKYDTSSSRETREVNEPIKNKADGLAREKEVSHELEQKYPQEKGYQVVSEPYLRDKDGNIVKDSVTDSGRRVDFVVVKDGKAVDSVEVTSQTADKTEQSAKEDRIRESGGNYIRDNNGDLVEIPDTVQTRIERKD